MLEDLCKVPTERVTERDVIEIYKIFCEVYKIERSKIEFKQDEHQIIGMFKETKYVDFRPYMGSKFFVQGKKGIRFHGYSEIIDPWSADEGEVPKWYRKEREEICDRQERFNGVFQKSVAGYFKKLKKI